ncbi:lysozyme [Oscillatoria sp. CS-180]|uniref:lysozyme n=1 Tax=Oscillatoria sp. CS-180 TaxID=3021720 RepID=UPI0023301C30|nr:lysozyme [Oscillatoria sp. CS-180]MDB9529195.1 lysozyme [Oscillatoria sp. CS-180]
MGTWIKETSKAIYLMEGGYWISRLTKYPSSTNPQEQVLNVSAIRSWFTRPDYPRAMTVSLSGPEPPQKPTPPTPPPAPPPSSVLDSFSTPAPPASTSGTDRINDDGLTIVKRSEGLELTAYQDSVGVWTIGYGHTSAAGDPQVYAGQTITEAEAEAILRKDLRYFENGVRNAVKVPVNSNQFSALVSFAFNLGVGALEGSTLLRKLNAGDYQGAADEFPRWVKAGGQTLPGLVKRRRGERALFLSQPYAHHLP